VAEEKKNKQDFNTKESKSSTYRAKLGSAVEISGIIPSIEIEWTTQILLPI